MSNQSRKLVVEKRNALNEAQVIDEVRRDRMSLQELRLFSYYLARINARDPSTRVVRFPIAEFQRIMGFKENAHLSDYKKIFKKMLRYSVCINTPSGGVDAFQIFSRFRLEADEWQQWYVEIDAHDAALPLLFNFKEQYFTYSLWNTLSLSSVNQMRMYEILKQHEHQRQWEVSVAELRELIGISPKEHTRWESFKRRVLDSSQKALLEKTDIMFSYKRGLCGNGGKWLTIVFTIEKNPNYVERYDLNGVFGTTPPSNSPDEPDEDAPSDSQKKGVPDDDDDGNFQPLDIGTENNQPSDKSTTSKKKKLDDEDEREEICMGFGDAAFDEFSLEELKALKTLAARCVSKEEVNFHAKLLPYKEAMEFATSEFLRQLILECDANRTVRNLYKYLLAVLKNKVREKMSDC